MSKLILAVCLALVGCAPSPAEQCDTFVDTFCAKVAECTGTSANKCVAEASTALACSRAVDVTDSYDACLNDLDREPCTAFIQNGAPVLPADCKGVILTK